SLFVYVGGRSSAIKFSTYSIFPGLLRDRHAAEEARGEGQETADGAEARRVEDLDLRRRTPTQPRDDLRGAVAVGVHAADTHSARDPRIGDETGSEDACGGERLDVRGTAAGAGDDLVEAVAVEVARRHEDSARQRHAIGEK